MAAVYFLFFAFLSFNFQCLFGEIVPKIPASSIDVNVLKYKIYCPLQWSSYNKQGQPLPSNTVVLNEEAVNSYIITRTRVYGKWVAGSLGSNKTASFISSKDGKTINKRNNFEILTNPNGCLLHWSSPLSINQSHTFVSLNAKTPSSHIGRVQLQNGNFQICNSETRCGTSYENIEVLQSLKTHLSFRINHISVFERVEALSVELEGFDRILNKADVDVSSTVTYSRTVSKGDGTHLSVTGNIGAPPANLAGTFGRSVDNDETEDLDVVSDINVPPLTLVEFCSCQTVPNLVINFMANVTYFADGVDAEAIKEILKMENFQGPFFNSEEHENAVATILTGEISDIEGMIESTFRVNPIQVFEPLKVSCENTAKMVDLQRREKVLKNLNSNVLIVKNQIDLKNVIQNAYKRYGSWLKV